MDNKATFFQIVLPIWLCVVDVDSLCSEFDAGSPLHIAAANLAYESGKVLLNNGANPHIKDDLGRLPIGELSFSSVLSFFSFSQIDKLEISRTLLQ